MGPLSHIQHALVVEDEYLLATDLRDYLQRLGCHNVRLAMNGSDGERSLALGRPGLVTLDVRLGNSDCDRLADILAARGIAFLYVSGFSRRDKPDLPDAPWVTKPLDELELACAVQALGVWATPNPQPHDQRLQSRA